MIIHNETLKEVMDKMFAYEGITHKEAPDDYVFNDAYSWSIEEQDEFALWLTNKLISDIKFRKLLLSVNTKRTSFLRRAAEQFVFRYGLRLSRHILDK